MTDATDKSHKKIQVTLPKASAGVEYRTCRGCGLCLLPCPVFKSTGDITRTAHGRMKALQWGAEVTELADSIDECILCAACEPTCPVSDNNITGFTLTQRRELNTQRVDRPQWYPKTSSANNIKQEHAKKEVVLILNKGLIDDTALAEKVVTLLGGARKVSVVYFDSDIFETGLDGSDDSLKGLIRSVKDARNIISTNGLIMSELREVLPGKKISTLGESLLLLKKIQQGLSSTDMLVIDSRAFNSEHKRLISFYDRIIKKTGMETNLDLNRVAIPTGSDSLQERVNPGPYDPQGDSMQKVQARWILKGKNAGRIVVENPADVATFKSVTDLPVMHLCFVQQEKEQGKV